MFTALSPAWGLGLALLLVAAAIYRLARRTRHRADSEPGSRPNDPVQHRVDLPQPASAAGEFYLSCPNCEFAGPLEDLELVGQAVECPMCEQPFVLLDPQSNVSQYAGVK